MDWKHVLSIAFSLVALVTGLIAARKWYLASKVKHNPAWELVIDLGAAPHNIMGHVAGLMIAWQQAGRLNATAAVWTACSIVCSGSSALFGAI